MTTPNSFKIVDGNEATAAVAYRAAEVIAIYPITPSSTMGELADQWATEGRTNLRGAVPRVIAMQSEGGAAGAVHGALQAGALTTTFSASQGLLLMIPNLYKIAGELTPFVIHVAARAVATHALSIFGDHSDVMACRQTGLAMLCAGSVQEAQDLAAVAHSATLTTRVPFMHFFDGFRTSHELSRIHALTDADLTALIDEECVTAHRHRALSPDHPVIRGTAQNPDTYFQAREAVNPYYQACPAAVQSAMNRLAERTRRSYRLFDYHGHPEAERVIVLMGSGAEVAHEAVDSLVARGEKVGIVKVRLYRPFSVEHFLAAVPQSARAVAVLDRTKEPGAVGEPLYQDVVASLAEARQDGVSRACWPAVFGGRYGLSSKEFDPAMVMAVFDNLSKQRPRNHFTIGIVDDVSGTSLPWDPELTREEPDVVRALFYGLGSDGTVSANKNSIKIIGEETGRHVQAYFVYDSKKSGAMTVSHLRFGPRPIRSSYLISQAGFVACHQFGLLRRVDVLERAASGATVLLNAPYGPDAVFAQLPRDVQETLLSRRLRLHVIDADRVARETGLAGRINTIMQTCFFALSGVLPREEAIARIKRALEKSYAKAGKAVIEGNLRAVDAALSNLFEVSLPEVPSLAAPRAPLVPDSAPDFVRRVQAALMAGQGDRLPVSAFPVDGTWPTGTARYEKRNLADEIPVWDPSICIQCNKCVIACPHAAIRARVFDPALASGAPPTFKSTPFKAAAGGPWSELAGQAYALQVAPEDCTGCRACVEVCPARDRSNPKHKAIDMRPQAPLREAEAANLSYFLDLPEPDHSRLPLDVRGSQLREPLFEYSGACSGCGETPYVKLLTQLFGDRLVIANATGCSSIYGGNLPTTPYTVDRQGRGPAWANSLFEDNAEFGLGIRLGIDQHTATARRLVGLLSVQIGMPLAKDLLEPLSGTDAGIATSRERVALLRERLVSCDRREARELERCADYLVKKSVWIVGGDGWAYDIGFGGLDHVLASGHDVNVLVLDTQVYSNTGGQASKATPLGATAKFASAGKSVPRKDLGLIAMSYGHVYVASTAYGAKDQQTVKALVEAEAHAGPSLVVAYSPCIAHGYDLAHGPAQSKRAVDSGAWLLYRFDPTAAARGEPPLSLDSGPPKLQLAEYMRQESRFRLTEAADPARYRRLVDLAGEETRARRVIYEQLARLNGPADATPKGRP